jgi:hypothetical protein
VHGDFALSGAPPTRCSAELRGNLTTRWTFRNQSYDLVMRQQWGRTKVSMTNACLSTCRAKEIQRSKGFP